MFDVFILSLTETTYFQLSSEQTLFDHDWSNVPPHVNNFHSETCFVRDQTKQVSASVNTVFVHMTPDNSDLQEKSKKVRVIASLSYPEQN